MSRIRALLFDLDGTLLASAPDLINSLNWVRHQERLPPLRLSDMKRFASKGAVGLLRAGMPEADAATFEGWRQRFLEHYALNSYRHSSLFDGVPDLLDYLGRTLAGAAGLAAWAAAHWVLERVPPRMAIPAHSLYLAP